jgi:transcriptional regulator with XRE-family HTH domain
MIKPIRLNLAHRLKNRRFRERFIATLARDEIASQIRELRQKRGFETQTKFAKEAGMQQSAVSRIEQSDYSGWTFKTLLKVALTLNARLRVTFQPIEDVRELVRSSEASATQMGSQQNTTLDSAGTAHGLIILQLGSDPRDQRQIESVTDLFGVDVDSAITGDGPVIHLRQASLT